MGKKRIMRRLEFEMEIRRSEPDTLRQIGLSGAYLRRTQHAQPARVIGAQLAIVQAGRAAYPSPHISMMPYALVMSVMSIGLLVLMRLFTLGGLPLPIFLLGGFGVTGLGLAGCAYIAIRSWRAAQDLRQWQAQMVQPRQWSWE